MRSLLVVVLWGECNTLFYVFSFVKWHLYTMLINLYLEKHAISNSLDFIC